MMSGCLLQIQRSPSVYSMHTGPRVFGPGDSLGVFGDARARVVRLVQRSRKRPVAAVAGYTMEGTVAPPFASRICPAGPSRPAPMPASLRLTPALSEVILRILRIEIGVCESRAEVEVLVPVVLDELVIPVIDSDP